MATAVTRLNQSRTTIKIRNLVIVFFFLLTYPLPRGGDHVCDLTLAPDFVAGRRECHPPL